jgi:hypothetical protein
MKPFTDDAEQCFLFGYRAACHELHQKVSMWHHAPSILDLVHRGRTPEEQVSIQREQRMLLGATGWALMRQQRWKRSMDDALRVWRRDQAAPRRFGTHCSA